MKWDRNSIKQLTSRAVTTSLIWTWVTLLRVKTAWLAMLPAARVTIVSSTRAGTLRLTFSSSIGRIRFLTLYLIRFRAQTSQIPTICREYISKISRSESRAKNKLLLAAGVKTKKKFISANSSTWTSSDLSSTIARAAAQMNRTLYLRFRIIYKGTLLRKVVKS